MHPHRQPNQRGFDSYQTPLLFLPVKRNLFTSGLATLAASFVILATHFAPLSLAQAPTPIFVPVALAPSQPDSPIELVALTYDGDIREINNHTIITGSVTFKLHNTDRLNDLQAPVGFPSWAGDPYAFDPSRLDVFLGNIDGRKINLTSSRADLKLGTSLRNVDWYTFTLPIAGDEKRTVEFDFQQDLGESVTPRITFGLVPANNWKGNIGSARLTLNFPETTTLEQIITYDPPNPTFNGTSFTWLFQNHQASTQPYITIIKPSVWNDLLTRRRAARQTPNDANAHAALGSLYRMLAQPDSPKSESFYAQAVAELETAIRIDTNLKNARQSLAALYEARRTRRRTAKQRLQLAIQNWEALAPGDPSARRQLAEDYFYLGLDAQTRRAFADAQKYFDKATALAPSGAGPLFTSERAIAQRRSMNLAWGRQSLDNADFATAMDRGQAALGDAFTKSFRAPDFTVTRAQVTTASDTRTLVFSLTPFAATVEELKNAASGVVTAARALGADGSVTNDNSNIVLTISMPFQNVTQLTARQAALAKFLGSQPDWALVRAVLSPTELAWSENSQSIVGTPSYREGVDLAGACASFNAQMQPIAQSLAPLENIPANDEEKQFRRALLKSTQAEWQSALASGVTYRAGSNEFVVEPCATRVIASSLVSIQPIGIALIGVPVVIVIGGMLLLITRKNRRAK
jgi:hypothetical protein